MFKYYKIRERNYVVNAESCSRFTESCSRFSIKTRNYVVVLRNYVVALPLQLPNIGNFDSLKLLKAL